MTSSSTTDYITLLASVSNYVDIYMSSIFFVTGLINAVMILFIFTRHQFRQSSSSIYILTKAICDIILLNMITFSRLYAGATGTNATLTNVIWCKLRSSAFTFVTCFSFGCVYLSGFDQWVCTSRDVRKRQWHSKRVAYYAILTLFIFSLGLTGVPIFVMYLPRAAPPACTFTTIVFAEYYNLFFSPMVFCILPIVVPVTFGLFTYRNIRLFTNRTNRIERQLTRMILLQLVVVSIVSIPYAIFTFYNAATLHLPKDSLRLAQEYLYSTVTRNFFQVHYVDSFYIFYITSNEIRNILKRYFARIIRSTRVSPADSS